MNQILDNIGIEFDQLVILIIVIVASIVVIRITISFDINKYLERREERYLPKLQNACPHVRIIPHKNNKIEAKLLFISPPGTHQWQCQQCGAVKFLAYGEGEELQKLYLENPELYNKKVAKFGKLLKKSGKI